MNPKSLIRVVLVLALLVSVSQALDEASLGSGTTEKSQTSVSLSDQILLLLHPEPATVEEEQPLNLTAYCRYPDGTVLAWIPSERQGEGEYQGEVLGKVVGYNESIPGTSPPANLSPFYILSLHPYYQSSVSSVPENVNQAGGALLAYYPCSYLDTRTEAWEDEVDWESILIMNESGAVIGKSNQTGLYRLNEGRMVEGDPAVQIPEVPPDPLEFLDALPLLKRFEYEDEQHENMLSLGIVMVRTMKSYTLWDKKNDLSEGVAPHNGSTFLMVYIDVYHHGHKAYTYQYQEDSPDPSQFRVFYGGYNYTTLEVPRYIKSGPTWWNPYTKTRLDRYEHAMGALLFEVPTGIDWSRTYLQADLGDEGMPIWRLG